MDPMLLITEAMARDFLERTLKTGPDVDIVINRLDGRSLTETGAEVYTVGDLNDALGGYPDVRDALDTHDWIPSEQDELAIERVKALR